MVAVRVRPVPSFLTVTVAPGRSRLVGSVTVPRMVAVVRWANAERQSRTRASARQERHLPHGGRLRRYLRTFKKCIMNTRKSACQGDLCKPLSRDPDSAWFRRNTSLQGSIALDGHAVARGGHRSRYPAGPRGRGPHRHHRLASAGSALRAQPVLSRGSRARRQRPADHHRHAARGRARRLRQRAGGHAVDRPAGRRRGALRRGARPQRGHAALARQHPLRPLLRSSTACATTRASAFPPTADTLATLLKARGYRTGAFVSAFPARLALRPRPRASTCTTTASSTPRPGPRS